MEGRCSTLLQCKLVLSFPRRLLMKVVKRHFQVFACCRALMLSPSLFTSSSSLGKKKYKTITFSVESWHRHFLSLKILHIFTKHSGGVSMILLTTRCKKELQSCY